MISNFSPAGNLLELRASGLPRARSLPPPQCRMPIAHGLAFEQFRHAASASQPARRAVHVEVGANNGAWSRSAFWQVCNANATASGRSGTDRHRFLVFEPQPRFRAQSAKGKEQGRRRHQWVMGWGEGKSSSEQADERAAASCYDVPMSVPKSRNGPECRNP